MDQKYWMLTFLNKTERRNKRNRRTFWMFKCDCWNIKEMVMTNVFLNWAKSCWCATKSRTHWLCESKIYWVYRAMVSRCTKPNNPSFHNYGWRGIKCEWKKFEDFFVDMWPTYKEWLSIDRTNNDWDYSKENCRWVTMKENERNKRTNILFQWKSLAQWGEELWIPKSTIYKRISRWWTMERAILGKS